MNNPPARCRLARETAAGNLTDTRRFIRELTPPNLDDEGLGAALRRLAETQWQPHGLVVDVRVTESGTLPMHLQTALLRIAQGALANVIQHAHATRVTITLTSGHDSLQFTVADDGRGFDVDQRHVAEDHVALPGCGLHRRRDNKQGRGKGEKQVFH